MAAFEQFMMYKKRVPVRGAIMLNEAMDAAVLVKGWKKGRDTRKMQIINNLKLKI